MQFRQVNKIDSLSLMNFRSLLRIFFLKDFSKALLRNGVDCLRWAEKLCYPIRFGNLKRVPVKLASWSTFSLRESDEFHTHTGTSPELRKRKPAKNFPVFEDFAFELAIEFGVESSRSYPGEEHSWPQVLSLTRQEELIKKRRAKKWLEQQR